MGCAPPASPPPASPWNNWRRSWTLRRADGREVALQVTPLTEALRTGERVRAEEIVLRIPDGRSITTLQDLQPIRELERLRSEFLGMVGHELRVPLSSI